MNLGSVGIRWYTCRLFSNGAKFAVPLALLYHFLT
jgi:hypothetical protein